MRKILTIALVALMAASLFAGVKTSGYVQGAAHADISLSSDYDPAIFPGDSDNKAQVNITDENKVWGTTLNAQNAKNVFKTKTWIDVMKLAQSEGDVSAKVTFLTWDNLATLSAYKNNADENNYWRLRDENAGENVSVEVGYSKYVTGQVGIQLYEGTIERETELALVASVLGTPVDGVKLSAGYLLYDLDADDDASGYVVAADVDAGKLADLDFSLGAGAAYRHFEAEDSDYLTMQVYGEYEGISGYAEIVMIDTSELKIGASYAINEKLGAGAYVFFGDYEDIKFDENVTVGAECDYKFADNISLYGNVEYGYGNHNGAVSKGAGKNLHKNIAVEARCKVTF